MISVSRETECRLASYIDLIARWNKSLNLVGRAETPGLRNTHIEECLELSRHLPPHASSGLDMGSGAGLPGLVLAITTGVPFILVEADHRKAAFLREAVRVTGAPAEIHATRVEEAVAQVDVVTARALAPLSTLLRWAHPLLRRGGMCLFLKGSRLEQELQQAAERWRMTSRIHPARAHPAQAVPVRSQPDRLQPHRPVPRSRIVEIQELSPISP